jgi:hypothetical protein
MFELVMMTHGEMRWRMIGDIAAFYAASYAESVPPSADIKIKCQVNTGLWRRIRSKNTGLAVMALNRVAHRPPG